MPENIFEKILVANRGEIAYRIMKTLRRMGIKSVAVYSESDTNSLHVQYADEAIYIGPSPATKSYLDIDNIIMAVRRSGAHAVHPGYGFLSENSNFAKALRKDSVAFIGPSTNAIRDMGDKIEAKKLAEAAGVSTVPGYMGIIENAEEAVIIASSIGFPVIVKAAGGGGGRGMRVVKSESEVREAFRSASSEARNSFSDDRVFMEKFIENPRHIEIQLLADKWGNAVCLGERECSIQRHHQKVIEEAPSSFIDEETRQNMYNQVISLSKKVGYYSAGTVEFIVDREKNFYFLEMNTRLQVEHCVTELVTGIDIVEQMIRIAAGERLGFAQDNIKLNGWAIESRIYAEDPSRGFLPSSGRITEYSEPNKNSSIRIDTGVNEGGEVSMFYDAMISKLCSYGENREDAIKKMQNGLGEYVIRGISHNISFLEAIMAHPRFLSGDISTNFIQEEYPEGFLGAELTSESNQNILAAAIYIYLTEYKRTASITGYLPGRKQQLNTRWVVTIDKISYTVFIKPAGDGSRYNIRQERQRLYVKSNWAIGSRLFRGIVNDRNISIRIEHFAGGYYLSHAGREVEVTVRSPRVAELEKFMITKGKSNHNNFIQAPLSGIIVAIKVAIGDKIKMGQEIAIIEAMKMENIIYAEAESVVIAINYKQGDNISTGEVIIELE